MKLYLGIIFLLIAFILGLNGYVYKDILLEKWKREYFNHQKVFHTKKYDMLFLGDSRTYYSLNPEVFKNSFNYAFAANTFSEEYLKSAEVLLKKNGAIILGITPESLSRYQMNEAINKHRQNILPAWDLFKIALRIWWPNWNLGLYFKRGWEAVKLRTDLNRFPIIYHNSGWWEAFPKIKIQAS